MGMIAKHEKQKRRTFWITLISVTAIGAIGVYWLLGPPPPGAILLATGEAGGGYAQLGERYKEELSVHGLDVDLVPSAGSVDNIALLRDGTVQAALIQSGPYSPADDPEGVVRGIASLSREPLWLLYRGGDGEMIHLYSLREKERISIGREGSGTEALAQVVLEIPGIEKNDPKIVRDLGMEEAVDRLVAGDLDAAFIVTSAENKSIKKALSNKDIRLMSFQRHVSFTRVFPYLSSVELTEGILDMEKNIPSETCFLVAPAALLVCHKDLHAQVVDQLLQAAEKIHSPGTLIERPGEYPSQDSMDAVPIHETARAYLRSDRSLLSRFLSYRAQRWVFKIQILAIPVLTLWFPFFKLLPLLYLFRVQSLLKLHYAALRDIETRIEQADNRVDLVERIAELERLRQDMEDYSKKMPAFYQHHIYQWRLHLTLVQEEAAGYLQNYVKTQVNEEVDDVERLSSG